MSMAKQVCPDAAFLLSAGDQIDKSGASKSNDLKTRESEYAGYLYPEVFRSLPIASTIGNHDTAGSDYGAHFNNPNTVTAWEQLMLVRITIFHMAMCFLYHLTVKIEIRQNTGNL